MLQIVSTQDQEGGSISCFIINIMMLNIQYSTMMHGNTEDGRASTLEADCENAADQAPLNVNSGTCGKGYGVRMCGRKAESKCCLSIKLIKYTLLYAEMVTVREIEPTKYCLRLLLCFIKCTR